MVLSLSLWRPWKCEQSSQQRLGHQEPTDSEIAVVSGTTGAKWAEGLACMSRQATKYPR